MTPGKVYLIGAGPGDVELLTLKAVRALGQADVVLLDALVNREVLDFARGGARVIDVGKRGGCKSTPQKVIQRLMLRFARAGAVVARVKGGDPFVFGRGGEEALALERAGIEVQVVNGITAGIGVPAALGIPVTHRDCCHGVTLVTGHTRDGGAPDWHALARAGTTLVIYMGMTRLAEISAALMAGGLAPHTPAAAIRGGTLPRQRQVVATLSRIADAVVREGFSSPALIVVGEVVRFARATAQTGELREVA